MLNIGDLAPSFTLQDQNDETHTLEEYRGKKLVLYFYPKDNTSGCTKQACGFSERVDAFKAQGYEIIGISKDTVKSHKKFEQNYDLKFTLLADPNKEVLEAYDVIKDKVMYGKQVKGTVRTTFLIDEEGKITGVFRNVKAADDPEEELQRICA